jgi:hypothetical protein
MNSDPFFDRVSTLIEEEQFQPEHFYYLSFAGATFNGAVVVKAHGPADALLKVHALHISPGGEVLSVAIPEDKTPDPKFLNRLLAKPEIAEMWGEPCKTIREWDEEEANSNG